MESRNEKNGNKKTRSFIEYIKKEKQPQKEKYSAFISWGIKLKQNTKIMI